MKIIRSLLLTILTFLLAVNIIGVSAQSSVTPTPNYDLMCPSNLTSAQKQECHQCYEKNVPGNTTYVYTAVGCVNTARDYTTVYIIGGCIVVVCIILPVLGVVGYLYYRKQKKSLQSNK